MLLVGAPTKMWTALQMILAQRDMQNVVDFGSSMARNMMVDLTLAVKRLIRPP